MKFSRILLHFLAVAAFLASGCTPLFAQQYRFKHVNASHGLSHNQVTALYKDRTGFLWIATISGLNRYDGSTIKVYRHDPQDSTSLLHDDIRGLFESPGGKMCVLTASGVCIYNPVDETFSSSRSQLKESFGLLEEPLNKIVKDLAGNYWFLLSDGGVMRYESEKKVTLHLQHDPNDSTTVASNNVTSIVQDDDKSFWLFHSNGVLEKLEETLSGFRISYRNFTFCKLRENANSYLPGNMLIDSDGDLWIYITHQPLGAFLFDRKTGKISKIHSQSAGPGFRQDIVSAVVQDNKGLIWLATDHGGINVLEKKTLSVRNIQNRPENESSLSQNSITTMMKDDEGIIWVGTYKKGVSYYHENIRRFPLYDRYSEPHGLPYEDINRLVEDHHGNLWIGTNGGGLIYFDRRNGKFTTYRHDPFNANSLSSDVIVSLLIDHEKKLWIGTYFGGLNCFDGKKFTRYKHDPSNPESLPGTSVWEILEDSQQRLWIGTLDGGLSLFDRQTKTFRPFEERGEKKMYSPYISVLAEDRDRNIWVGTSDGIFKLQNSDGRFVHYHRDPNNPSTLMDNSILCFHQDVTGRIWLGTLGGLSLFDGETETFRTFTQKDGLPHNAVVTILEDAVGNIWIATPGGLTKMTMTSSLDPSFQTYSEADGLQSKLFNENASLRMRSGELVFGGPNGFNLFRPEEIGQENRTAKVVLSDLQLFNKSVAPLEVVDGHVILDKSVVEEPSVELPSDKNVFSIEVAVLNFIQPENTIYRYKLEGFNDDWLVADSKSRKVTFTNLNPGNYVFRATTKNSDGTWSEHGASLPIRILPPFWKSDLAMLIYSALVGLLLFVGRRIIQEREKMKYAVAQEREQTIRARELDDMKTRFFTNVSHEFRTPLSLILSPLETMMAQTHDDEQKKHFELMRRNGKRLLNLVNQLLDFRKLEAYDIKLHLTEGDIIAFIGETVWSFTDLSERKDIRLRLNSSVSNLTTVFDHDKLEKILFNLLSNAFKFTLPGGEVSVSLNLVEADHQQFLEIKVKDTGIGISADKKDKIFERYFQNDLPRTLLNQGSGIGLSITREFVRICGGTIHVESEPGKGSCFTVKIPLQETASLPAQNPIDVTVLEPNPALTIDLNSPRGKRTVLLVEDNEDFRFYLKDNLKREYFIIEAQSGEEAWEKIVANPPDIVVSDVMMPGMSGIELCRKLKTHEKFHFTPVILLTARVGDSDRLEGIECGADDYINKPFNFQILESRIRNLITQHAFLHSELIKRTGITVTELNITSADEQFLQKVIEVIEKNVPNSEFSVEDLCRELGVSRSRFFKRVQTLTGKSPMELIRNVRMQHAAQLLEKSQLSVSEVAYRVGFNNPKYFARYFKELYHVLPSVYANSRRRG